MAETAHVNDDDITDTTADTAAAPSVAPAVSDDVDSSIAEFEAAQPTAPTVDKSAEPEPSPDALDAMLRDGEGGRTFDPVDFTTRLDQANQRTAELEQAVQQFQHREWLRQEERDIGKVVAEMQEGVSDLKHLPADYAERWLHSESLKNPMLRKLFDNRNNPNVSAQGKAAIARYITNNTIKKFVREARSQINPEATADREMIVQSMTSGRGKFDAAEPPPNLGRLSDRELNKYSEDKFGFKAI